MNLSALPGILSPLVFLTLAAAADGFQDTAAPEGDEVLKQLEQDVDDYEMSIGSERIPLQRHPGSVLNWGNAARNGENGAVFLWLRDGRPAVAGAMFEFQIRNQPRLKHAFVSLAPEALVAERKGALAWAPQEPGVLMRPVPEAPPVANAERLRLVQMRALARQFSAALTDLKGQRTQLRLLPQPLFRYQPGSDDVLDGALFAFAVATDPEVLLMVEARRGEDGTLTWHYGVARFHLAELVLHHGGKEVWRAEPSPDLQHAFFGQEQYQSAPYISFFPNRNRAR